MPTLEEQIRIIADEAVRQLSAVPSHGRRLPLLWAAAASVALVAGAGIWLLTTRDSLSVGETGSSVVPAKEVEKAHAGPAATIPVAASSPSESHPTTPPATSTTSLPMEAGVALRGNAALSCTEEYNLVALAQRAFAFDGTVVEIGDPEPDPAMPFVDVTFEVNEWFRPTTGPEGGPQQIVVEMFPPYFDTSVGRAEYVSGSRLLITGEPRWEGSALDSPVAWLCGFSQTYNELTATEWREAMQARAPMTAPTTATPTTTPVSTDVATDAATQVGMQHLERVLPPLSPAPEGVVDAEALLGEVASGVTIELVASAAPAPEGLVCLDWIAEGARASSCGSGPDPGLLTAVMFSHPERRAIVVIAATSTSRLDVDSPCDLREVDISETATIAACDVGWFVGELPLIVTIEGQRWSSTIEVPELPHP